jgi:hypothetical protein
MSEQPKVWLDEDGTYRWNDDAVVDVMVALIEAMPSGSTEQEVDKEVMAYLSGLYRQRLH